MEYLTEIPVRFADVDAAGIVYYPQFFDYYHCAFEELFGDATGTPYPEWLSVRRRGFPTVHVEADFKSPLEYGHSLHIAITVPRIGGTSLDFQFVARNDHGDAATARIAKVCIDMDAREPAPIPDDLREILQKYGAA